MCFEYHRIIFHWKNGSKFSHLVTVRAARADPTPPYGEPDCKISVFYGFPNFMLVKVKHQVRSFLSPAAKCESSVRKLSVCQSVNWLSVYKQTLSQLEKNMAIDKFMTRLVTAGWSCWHLHQLRFIRVLSWGVPIHQVESKTLPPSLRWKPRGKSPSLSPTKQNSKLSDFDAFHTCTFEQKFCRSSLTFDSCWTWSWPTINEYSAND